MIVLDTETTGMDPDVHALISVGAVELKVQQGKVESVDNEFYGECRVWEGAHIMEEALEVNNFTREDIEDESKQSLEILMQALMEWVGKCEEQTVAGIHVGYFDLRFLEASCKRVGVNFPLAKRTIDLHTIVYSDLQRRGEEVPLKNNHSGIDSRFIYDYVGLEGIEVPHNAMQDAKLEAESLARLWGGKGLYEEYNDYVVPRYLQE